MSETNTPIATPQSKTADIWLWRPCKKWTLAKLDGLSKNESIQFQLKPEKSRWQFAASKLFQRHVLSFYTGKAPRHHSIMKKKYGKPYLENSPLFFNASHSQGIMVVAVTYKTEVGLDIAVHCLSHKWKRLAKYILNKNEYVKNANEFYHVWALKESLLKATGEGLVHGASHLTFKPRHFKTNSTIIYTKRTQNWWSYLITSPIPNTSLALTSHSALNNIQLMNFVPDSPESE